MGLSHCLLERNVVVHILLVLQKYRLGEPSDVKDVNLVVNVETFLLLLRVVVTACRHDDVDVVINLPALD